MAIKRKDSHSAIYLLPNLLTTSSLFAAFFSIVASFKLQFESAAIAIFIGIIADSLDGRIARMTNTQSAFGAEYDSLSDMVTFGVAPALLLYSWTLQYYGKFGWLIAFFYTAAVALRLARFNTQLDVADKRFFQGLPSPAAAAMVASFVWICTLHEWNSPLTAVISCIISPVVAILMVSNVRYYSFKDLDVKGKVPFLHIFVVVVSFIAIALNPSIVLFVSFSAYVLSGIFTYKKNQRELDEASEEKKKGSKLKGAKNKG